jgi:SAM-dependent methyltransferase
MNGTVESWNHNTIYHSLVLDAVRPGYRRALDVGCGEGRLTRELRQVLPEVVGIDIDHASIEMAKNEEAAREIQYIEDDVLNRPFEPGSFDLVATVAALHHMDAEVALKRFAELLRPGGSLVVIGCARSSPSDMPLEIVATVVHRIRSFRRTYWQHPSPTIWPPPETYASMRQIVGQVLPGARFRRRLFWRYSVVWTKPSAEESSTMIAPGRAEVLSHFGSGRGIGETRAATAPVAHREASGYRPPDVGS